MALSWLAGTKQHGESTGNVCARDRREVNGQHGKGRPADGLKRAPLAGRAKAINWVCEKQRKRAGGAE